MNRTPLHRKPKGIDQAYDVPPLRQTPGSLAFHVPPTLADDFERWLMGDVPNSVYTFELVRDWYAREAGGYAPAFIRGMHFPINWKSKIGNSDANSNFRTHLRVDIRKGDLVVREDGTLYMLNWQVQRHPNNQSTQAVDCNAFLAFWREVDEVLDDRGYLVEPAHREMIAPAIPGVYAEYAGRPDYAPALNTPGIHPDHLLTVQVQYNSRTREVRIGDQFELMHSTYRVVHLMYHEVDIDGVYGIINITARKAAGEGLP